MSKRFLTPININNLPSDPVSASEGDFYYNTTLDKLKVYTNSSWVEVGGSQVSVSDSSPGSSATGSLWFDTENLDLYIYYDSFWVQVGGGGSGGGSNTVDVVSPLLLPGC